MKKIKSFLFIASLMTSFVFASTATFAETVDSKKSEATVGFYYGDSTTDTTEGTDSSSSSEEPGVNGSSNKPSGVDNNTGSKKDIVSSYPKTGSTEQASLMPIGVVIIGLTTIVYFKKKKESE